jgi:hypothetical protein
MEKGAWSRACMRQAGTSATRDTCPAKFDSVCRLFDNFHDIMPLSFEAKNLPQAEQHARWAARLEPRRIWQDSSI